MKIPTKTIGQRLVQTARSYSGLFGMLSLAVGCYSFSPFLHSETWGQVRYQIKNILELFHPN